LEFGKTGNIFSTNILVAPFSLELFRLELDLVNWKAS